MSCSSAPLSPELGILSLIKLGVRVITASGDDLTDTSDPMKTTMRQVAGAFAQLEKARVVAKLKGAREHKKASLWLRQNIQSLVPLPIHQRVCLEKLQ